MNNYIRKNFIYNYKNGHITRIDRKNSNGSIDRYGYLILKVKGKQYKSHRIAWFLYYGKFPKKIIDHINGNKIDNRIVNLRDCNQFVNCNNIKRKINKDTGVSGVYIDRTKGLKKNFAVKAYNKTFRFYLLEEAIKFKKDYNNEITRKINKHTV